MTQSTVLVINAILAGFASSVNVWVALQWRNVGRMQWIYYTVAFFAAFYSLGFVYILVIGDGKFVPISRVMALFVWPIVWTAPSLLATTRMKAAAATLAREVAEKEAHLDRRAEQGLEL